MSRPALLDKLFQAGEWLLKPGLVPIDDVTIKRNQTVVYVALDALIRQGGGLAVGQDKRIYVDFSLMPTDAFEDLLKSIRVPVWLTKNMTIYVATTGSDTLDEGRGLTEDKPFKTVQAALQYTAETYNISDKTLTIQLAAGDYGRTTINLPDYQSTTGSIELKGVQNSAEEVRLGQIVLSYAKDYYVSDLTTRCRDFSSGILGNLEAADGVLHPRNVICDLTETLYTGGALWALYAHAKGKIMIWAASSSSLTTGITLKAEGKEIDGFIYSAEGGILTYAADINIIGDTTVKSSTVQASALSQVVRSNSSLVNPGRVPNVNVAGTITGRRYISTQLSIISVRNAGADFYPGTEEGVISSGGQYT